MSIETVEVNDFQVNLEHDPHCESPRDAMHSCELVMAHRLYDWPNDAEIDFDAFDGWQEIAQHLRNEHKALYVVVVYAYDHSGVSFTVGHSFSPVGVNPFDTEAWDTGIAGLAYVTENNWKDTQGTEWADTEENRKRAQELIMSDVEKYDRWENGECYGYIIKDFDGEIVDSCWGFLGYEFAEESAREAAEDLTHDIKCNGELNRLTGNVEHKTTCPIHN